MKVQQLIATLKTERDRIDTAIQALAAIGGRETSEGAAVVRPRKARRKKRSPETIAKFKATIARKKADAASKANGHAGMPPPVEDRELVHA